MFQKNTPGEARVGARDGYNRMVSPHVRLFPHNISENPSYSLPSTIRCTIARDALSPICGIFVVVEEVYTEYGLQEGVCFTACVVENYFLLLKFYLMKIKYIFFNKYIPHPFNHLSIK